MLNNERAAGVDGAIKRLSLDRKSISRNLDEALCQHPQDRKLINDLIQRIKVLDNDIAVKKLRLSGQTQ